MLPFTATVMVLWDDTQARSGWLSVKRFRVLDAVDLLSELVGAEERAEQAEQRLRRLRASTGRKDAR